MNTRELAYWAEELTLKALKIESFEEALFEAIFRGDKDVSAFEWAFMVFGNMVVDMRNDIQKMTDELFLKSKNEEADVNNGKS